MLAHALRATWQQRHGHTLTVEGYRTTGGIHRAVATTADRVFTGLNPPSQHAARTLFLRLIKIGDGTEDTRRRMPRTDLLQGLDPGSALPHKSDLSPIAFAFLAASTRQEHRAARLRRAAFVVLFVLALVASGAAVFAFSKGPPPRANATPQSSTGLLPKPTG